jgi:DNA-binding protein Fis
VDDYERALIDTALRQTGGNQTRAARLLGLRVQTLNMKLKRSR